MWIQYTMDIFFRVDNLGYAGTVLMGALTIDADDERCNILYVLGPELSFFFSGRHSTAVHSRTGLLT